VARRPKNALSLQDDAAGNPLSAPGDISEAAESPPIGSSGWAANFRPSTNIEDRRGQDPEIARMWGIVNGINGADANGAVNFMQRPGYNDPYKPMSPADVWEWHKQNAADAWKAAQDPQTWRDAAQQYGQALLMGSVAPGGPGIFHRFTRGPVDNGIGYMMYADNPMRVSGGNYGRNHYTLDVSKIDPSMVVDASSARFQAMVRKSLRDAPELVDSFQSTPKALAADTAPPDVVNGAGAWDSPELVQHIWENVLEPNGWTLVKTPDGVVSFDPAHATHHPDSEWSR
jgi:hypothetical protein